MAKGIGFRFVDAHLTAQHLVEIGALLNGRAG